MPFRVRHVLAATVLLAACGGRYSHIEGEGGAASGGSTGSGGSGQGGKKPGASAGTSSAGGAASAGSVGTAGTATSTGGKAGCACPDIDCAPGYVKQPAPSGCCEVCVPLDCRLVGCPGIACGPGSELIYPPDQCCPVCGPSNCEAQRRGYFEYRAQLIEKYNSLGCMTDMDCTLLVEANICALGCGMPIPRFYENEVLVNLHEYASNACASCPSPPPQPCPPSRPAGCVQGRCQIDPFR